MSERDGKGIDKYGACKVCDGEIPHGHIHECDIWKLEQQVQSNAAHLQILTEKFNAVTEMVARYLVANKGRVPGSWLEGFVECGAVTIGRNYPTTFIAPVVIKAEADKCGGLPTAATGE